MPGEIANNGSGSLPAGFTAVPISIGQEGSPVKVCVLAQPQATKIGGHFQILRDLLDGQVFFGCIVDAAGAVLQWLELWVQDGSHLATALPAAHQSLSNLILDVRWHEMTSAMRTLPQAGVVATGWETVNPVPTFINLVSMTPVHPIDDQGRPILLCKDDALLASAGLPAYGSSLHRYLCSVDRSEPVFYGVSLEAPANDRTRPLSSAFKDSAELVPFNPGAGLIFARLAQPLTLECYIDFLSGASEEEVLQFNPNPGFPVSTHKSVASSGWLFLGQHGVWGRAMESFHLKLSALSSAVKAVRSLVEETQKPMLNLTDDSFRIGIGDSSAGLPWLWTTKVFLVHPGNAFELSLKTGNARYFMPTRDMGVSAFRPAAMNRSMVGNGAVRIRRVTTAAADEGRTQIIIEGTLIDSDSITARKNDLLWLRLGIANDRLDFYARLEAESSLSAGETRFRTLEQYVPETVLSVLRSAEGVSFPNVTYGVLPSMNAPCDLYALAVIASRALLVNRQRSLAVAVDDLSSLARQVASDAKALTQDLKSLPPLPERLMEIFKREPRWQQSLGPQFLASDPVPVESVFDVIPRELWFETLSTLIRMLPGIGPDSDSLDFGHVRAGGPHLTFDRAAADLDALIIKSRSLILIDWKYNRQVDSVLQKRLAKAAAQTRPGEK